MTFVSRYRGRCAGTDHWFAEGTPIQYTPDGEIVCEDCARGLLNDEARQDARDQQPPCPVCFLVGPHDCRD